MPSTSGTTIVPTNSTRSVRIAPEGGGGAASLVSGAGGGGSSGLLGAATDRIKDRFASPVHSRARLSDRARIAVNPGGAQKPRDPLARCARLWRFWGGPGIGDGCALLLGTDRGGLLVSGRLRGAGAAR